MPGLCRFKLPSTCHVLDDEVGDGHPVLIDISLSMGLLQAKYKGLTQDSLKSVLLPAYIPILRIDKTLRKNGTQWTASFVLDATDDELLVPGQTGKFVRSNFVETMQWKELAKGRIIAVSNNLAEGEIYVGSNKKDDLSQALTHLQVGDLLEIDRYGTSGSFLSGLVEHEFVRYCRCNNFKVKKMPGDCAKHIGRYYNFDFAVSKNDTKKKVEIKSLWGTNTKYARLIHTKSKHHSTSSCRFDSQDIFAVSLYLRTGCITDFAFARSRDLPPCAKYPDYLHQNPICEVDEKIWYSTLDEVF